MNYKIRVDEEGQMLMDVSGEDRQGFFRSLTLKIEESDILDIIHQLSKRSN